MHYYSQNIGDYRRDTTHLTLLEHGVYRQLIDTYYLMEKPLTLDHADLMRTHCARSADEVRAIENVLKDFFVRTDEGYMHKRCDIEIDAFHAKSTSARESAKARWARVREEKDANALRTQCEGNANHKPITNNQEPITKKIKSVCADPQHAELFARFWSLYPNRKGKADAEKAWAKLKPTDDLFAQICEGLAKQVTCHDWTKDGGKFIPHPATWLNGKRWTDEVKLEAKPLSVHGGFDDRDYNDGLITREDGSLGL